ncbi:acyl-CoA dehydrogenase family protein [Ilumatobacter sp.]|uniref:acyl-CoA dehydrogenase family protein n=1 Tax=Ilumatobacter sp. TaxID=1967498 RepID=UPI003C3DF69B
MDANAAVNKAESLVDLIAECAGAGEHDRQVPQEVVDAIAAEGLFEIVVPTSLGGHGLGLEPLAEVTRTLGQGCPATAWTMSFLMMHAWLLSKFPEEGHAELFADTAAPFAPAPLAPTGTSRPVEGGYMVSGRWEWATGSAHADWLMANTIVEGSEFELRFVVLPMSEVTMDDVWFTSGMRATRSNTAVVEERFVPEHRTIQASDMLNSTTTIEGDGLAGLPVMSVLALVAAAPALGGAEGAAEEYRTRLRDRVLAYSLGDKAAEQPAAQVRIATVDDLVRTAAARWRQAMAPLTSGHDIGEAERVDARLAAASVVKMSRQAVSTACEGAGASVYFDTHPLQRIQRDLETLKGHVIFDWDRTAELAGRHRLGLDLRPTDMV